MQLKTKKQNKVTEKGKKGSSLLVLKVFIYPFYFFFIQG